MALIPPHFLDCVVAIGANDNEGKRHWIASGFLYGRLSKKDPEGKADNYRTWFVSNRHVFEGKETVWLRFNPTGDQPPKEYEVKLVDEKGSLRWAAHPNTEIDVAVIGINYQLLVDQGMQVSIFRSEYDAWTTQKMREEEITEGDFAYVLGFPMGLVGDQRNTVIVRSGSLARIRYTLDDPKREFLIDATIFPGNSGGPVILKPEMVAITGTKSHLRATVIGIIKSYVPYQDIAISQQTQRPRVIFEENSGLAAAHSIDCIEETITLFEKVFFE